MTMQKYRLAQQFTYQFTRVKKSTRLFSSLNKYSTLQMHPLSGTVEGFIKVSKISSIVCTLLISPLNSGQSTLLISLLNCCSKYIGSVVSILELQAVS